MTTTPNPTAAEIEKALATAQAAIAVRRPGGPDLFGDSASNLARCYLALKAQLAESERAREALRAELRDIRDMSTDTFAGTSARDALAADQTTARESAENTAEETKMHDPHYDPACHRCGHVESDHGRGSRCGAPVADEDDYPRACRCAQFVPAPAQPPEPVEPSDDALWRIACGPDDAPNSTIDARRALYRAGLAAEAAAHAETRALAERYKQAGAIEIQKAADDYVKNRYHNAELIAELEQVRGENAGLREGQLDCQKALADAETELTALRAQARARRVPTREAIAELMYRVICARESPNAWKALHAKPREMYLETADAVLRLFAEAPPVDEPLATSDNEPPVPLPIILHCPECRTRHIDEGEFATKVHHTHSCQGCGLTWRPAVAPTVGVQFLPGFKNEEQRAAEPTPWKPTVGERAVLVASPDPDDSELVGRTLEILVEDYLENGDPHPGWYWRARDEGGDDVNIHRDATWRHASTPEAAWNYSAPPDSEIGKMHELLDSEHAQAGLESAMRYTGRDPDGDPAWDQGQRILGWSVKAWRPASAAPAKANESDSAWLKRTVEELTTARPVEVSMQPGGMLWFIEIAERRIPMGSAPVETRDGAWLASILAHHDLPKRDAKPAEPSPQPGGFLDALTRRVAALDQWRNETGPCVARLMLRVDKLEIARDRIEREERERNR